MYAKFGTATVLTRKANLPPMPPQGKGGNTMITVLASKPPVTERHALFYAPHILFSFKSKSP